MNSLVIALGSNVGNRLNHMVQARRRLKKLFKEVAASQIYQSEPVDYLQQNTFLNQVLEYELPPLGPLEVLHAMKALELELSGPKSIPKGPRQIDLDLIFLGSIQYCDDQLTVPHPAWSSRSFVVLPLKELPCFAWIKENYKVPDKFSSWCKIYQTTPEGENDEF